MATRPRLWTAEDFFELPGHEKVELWNGHPTGPKAMERRLSPFRRTMVELRLIQHLARFVAARDLGLFGPGFGFVGAAGRALHPPDLAFIGKDRLPPEDEWDGLCPVAPDLAIELLSPIDDSWQVTEEIGDYLAGGVPLLWLIDPGHGSLAAHTPGVARRTLTGNDELDGGDVLPDFRIQVAELFC